MIRKVGVGENFRLDMAKEAGDATTDDVADINTDRTDEKTEIDEDDSND